ncbi:MAG: WhiB family transcriptional regulator [Acidimicrobiia bacterium]|nr:WhiB family transcriptional regulator [Acidimicrobiia bacterium]
MKAPKPSWLDQAACRGLDPAIFFPVSDEEAGPAKAVCEMCDVRQACLEWALARREREGVWGGASERDRRRIIRQRRRSA